MTRLWFVLSLLAAPGCTAILDPFGHHTFDETNDGGRDGSAGPCGTCPIATPWCDPLSVICRQCLEDEHCEDGDPCTANACTTATGTCMAPLIDDTCVSQIDSGGNHSCALQAGGTARCWGTNGDGQVGDGTTMPRTSATAVVGLADATQLAAGYSHTCVLRTGGVVACWGRNDYGQAGVPTLMTPQTQPVTIAGLTDVVQVTAGRMHSCALQSTGRVLCWGQNDAGQIGDGTTTSPRADPTVVSGLNDAVEISAGYQYTCARRMSGLVVCWGDNRFHELGDGITTHMDCTTAAGVGDCSPSLVTVSGLNDAERLSPTSGISLHTCAIRATGGVVCWGDNRYGQLGDGSMNVQANPVAVTGLTGAVEVATGEAHTCALRDTGVGVCWGWNEAGQLGDGTSVDSTTPRDVRNLTEAFGVSAGGRFSCARRAGREVLCWGSNETGELGNGTMTFGANPIPGPVGGL